MTWKLSLLSLCLAFECTACQTHLQRDYQLVTGRVIPIVRFTVDENIEPFSYRVEDQAVVR
jgi:hypothetical protein